MLPVRYTQNFRRAWARALANFNASTDITLGLGTYLPLKNYVLNSLPVDGVLKGFERLQTPWLWDELLQSYGVHCVGYLYGSKRSPIPSVVWGVRAEAGGTLLNGEPSLLFFSILGAKSNRRDG